MKMQMGAAIIAVIIIAAAAGFSLLALNKGEAEVHEHADFMLYINNEAVNLSQEKYMTHEGNVLSNFIHLHDGDGRIIHKHVADIDMGFFFRSLDMRFNSSCISLGEAGQYCNEGGKRLRMFVNGKENFEFNQYEPHDLDRILITYGAEEGQIQQQIDSISSEACLYSDKCPEKGSPPEESTCSADSGKCFPEPLKNFG